MYSRPYGITLLTLFLLSSIFGCIFQNKQELDEIATQTISTDTDLNTTTAFSDNNYQSQDNDLVDDISIAENEQIFSVSTPPLGMTETELVLQIGFSAIHGNQANSEQARLKVFAKHKFTKITI
jgi:hypothetical protein